MRRSLSAANARHALGGLSLDRRQSFQISAELEAVFASLHQLGFVERAGRDYAWTGRIAPIMHQAYLWEPDEPE